MQVEILWPVQVGAYELKEDVSCRLCVRDPIVPLLPVFDAIGGVSIDGHVINAHFRTWFHPLNAVSHIDTGYDSLKKRLDIER